MRRSLAVSRLNEYARRESLGTHVPALIGRWLRKDDLDTGLADFGIIGNASVELIHSWGIRQKPTVEYLHSYSPCRYRTLDIELVRKRNPALAVDSSQT